MRRILRWLFPLAMTAGWIATAGHVLSRFASLQATLGQQAVARPPPIDETEPAAGAGAAKGRLAGMGQTREGPGP